MVPLIVEGEGLSADLVDLDDRNVVAPLDEVEEGAA